MFFAGMALGAMAGAAFGIGLMCCVVAGKREDQQMEQMRIRNVIRTCSPITGLPWHRRIQQINRVRSIHILLPDNSTGLLGC